MINNNKYYANGKCYKWMHTEVKGYDLKVAICRLLKERGLVYEPSCMGDDWYHIEVFCTDEEAAELNAIIDTF